MAQVPFKYYLHADNFHEMFEFAFRNTELAELSDDERDALLQEVGSPFYEVTLDCVLDTDTGKVTFQLAPGQGE